MCEHTTAAAVYNSDREFCEKVWFLAANGASPMLKQDRFTGLRAVGGPPRSLGRGPGVVGDILRWPPSGNPGIGDHHNYALISAGS
ncbi:hypothetical protein BJ970_007618 [Saccharopolyspora phatthalungensis]|uniref:Uncharacterized protein n=1 Tax=Saccharopolyspora phatthalungensis TaxID=664693 RepID=A0A840QID7_9PSEU|nr:hypothetical protein [Saccharopolyspora phatthalungensis]